MSADFTFQHVFQPGPGGRVLLMLHGTGGTEHDLLPLASTLDSDASVLSPRGRISEGGALRFFRRFGEGVFDQENMREETDALAAFVEQAVSDHGIEGKPMVAVGFSNGANIASSLMLRHPEVLAGAVLLRAMTPFEPDPLPDLRSKRIFIGSGLHDPIVPVSDISHLAELYRGAGAEVEHLWVDTGHNLTRQDIEAAKAWLDGPV
jgi:predicted esterase